MSRGRLIAVVGPSGVGKDSVMAGLVLRQAKLHLVRRMITRPANVGGEAFDAVTEQEFAQHVANQTFVLHWQAHGLRYGIPHKRPLHNSGLEKFNCNGEKYSTFY